MRLVGFIIRIYHDARSPEIESKLSMWFWVFFYILHNFLRLYVIILLSDLPPFSNINKLPRFFIAWQVKSFVPQPPPLAASWMLLIAPIVSFYKIGLRVIKNLSAAWLMRSFYTFTCLLKTDMLLALWCLRSLRMRLTHWSFKKSCLVCSSLFSYVQVCGFVSSFPMCVVDVCSEPCYFCNLMFTSKRLPVPKRSAPTRPEPTVRHNCPQISFIGYWSQVCWKRSPEEFTGSLLNNLKRMNCTISSSGIGIRSSFFATWMADYWL